jgi:hypothetical protein
VIIASKDDFRWELRDVLLDDLEDTVLCSSSELSDEVLLIIVIVVGKPRGDAPVFVAVFITKPTDETSTKCPT